MTIQTQRLINQVNDPATRKALHSIFEALVSDLAANKSLFDNHTHNHYGNGAEENTSAPQSDSATYTASTAVMLNQNIK